MPKKNRPKRYYFVGGQRFEYGATYHMAGKPAVLVKDERPHKNGSKRVIGLLIDAIETLLHAHGGKYCRRKTCVWCQREQNAEAQANAALAEADLL